MTMTRTQAVAYARKRFGPDGDVVRARKPATMIAKGGPNVGKPFVTRHVCLVGAWGEMIFPGFRYYGHGPTWAEAVADAERRAAKYGAWADAGFTTEFQRPHTARGRS